MSKVTMKTDSIELMKQIQRQNDALLDKNRQLQAENKRLLKLAKSARDYYDNGKFSSMANCIDEMLTQTDKP